MTSPRVFGRSAGILILFACTGLAVAEPETAANDRPAEKIASITVWPDSLTLSDSMYGRRLVVTGRTADGSTIDLTTQAVIKAGNAVVTVDADGFVTPVENGKSTLHVSVAGKSVDVPVTVEGQGTPRAISFVRDVVPVINKAGCTSGACHGNVKGKNGFKLSLRGYDPAGDYKELIDDVSARRINRSDPSQSLMLLKPTQGVPHEGGFVIEPDSRHYNTILQWITAGVPSDAGEVQSAQRIEVRPDAPLLPRPGLTQQLVVIAHYPDGTQRDVTREAHYASSKTSIAEVDDVGLVTTLRPGESAIVVRYEGRYATNIVSSLNGKPGFTWKEPPAHNYIDTLVYAKLERMHILPSALCDDAAFMRRVSFDLIGLPPTVEEVEAFLADERPTREKRQELIDRLMDRREFVDYWALKWSDLLQANRKFLGEKGVWAFRNWIRRTVARNMPFDEFARQLMTGSGSTYDNPAAAYFRVAREPSVAMENMTQIFLGTRFMCNKCHDHPFEKWTQSNYYELAAWFAQVGRKKGTREGEENIFERRDGGEVTHPKHGEVVPPAFPYSVPGLNGGEGRTRREVLAEWLTSPKNPLFAKSVANRIFAQFFHRGIVEPVDDLRDTNPPSNAALLDALTQDFLDHGFDVRHLIRTVVSSRVYQLDIETNEWNAADRVNFSHAIPRRLGAEQLLDAITVATGHHEKFRGVPSTFYAMQLPDGAVGKGGFLDLFGRPPRQSACACERRTEVSFSQALSLVNGPTIATAVSNPQGHVAQIVKDAGSEEQIARKLYLAALCRPPNATEIAHAVKHIQAVESREEGAQDVMWALLNSPAFLFNR